MASSAIAGVARRLRSRPDPSAAIDRVAAACERLAALLTAGLAPAAAWRNVDPSTDERPSDGPRDATAGDDHVIAAAAAAAGEGAPVADAIAHARVAWPDAAPAWSVLAAAWAVADASGAPLATCLAALAAALRAEAQLHREAAAALAGPAASAKLVAALPVIALAFGALLGFDTVGVLFGNPIGLGCLALGTALLWAGTRWSRRMVARAAASRPTGALELDLLAVAVSSGTSLARAEGIVADALRTHVPEQAGSASAAPVLRLAERAGAPVGELLRAEAHRRRGAAQATAAVRAAALGVRLMIPLGCCVLPAFVLLGVAPLLISVVTGTLGGAV